MNRGSCPDLENMLEKESQSKESWLSAFNKVVRDGKSTSNTVTLGHEFGSNRFTRSIIHFHFNQIAYMFTGHAPLFIGPIDSQHPSSHVDADIT